MLSCQQSRRTRQVIGFSTTDYASRMRVHNEDFSSTTYVAGVLTLLTCQPRREHDTFAVEAMEELLKSSLADCPALSAPKMINR